MRATTIGEILNVLVYGFYQQGFNFFPVLQFDIILCHLNIFLLQPLVKQDYHKTGLIKYGDTSDLMTNETPVLKESPQKYSVGN